MMEEREILKAEDSLALPPPPPITVAVAISGSKQSKWVLKWALEKFIPEGRILFKLLHVRPKVTVIPSPLGSLLISQVREDVATEYKKEVERKTSELLLPYKQMCARRKVQVDVMVIEADDVARAVSGVVAKFTISKLVIGASLSLFSRKFKGHDSSSKISECTPTFCTVYVVSKGNLAFVRPSTSVSNVGTESEISDSSESDNSSSYASSLMTGSTPDHSRGSSLDTNDVDIMSSYSNDADIRNDGNRFSSYESFRADNDSQISARASTSEVLKDFHSSGAQVDINLELERLRIELRNLKGMYAVAQTEKIDASQKLNDLHKRQLEEAVKLKEITSKEEEARELARQEKEKHKEARKEAEYIKKRAEREASQRKQEEIKANRDATEKKKLEKALASPVQPYLIFTWEEIVSATSSFSENLRIGMGAYGTVYKCSLNYTTAAVKVLHSKESRWTKQFEQELEILSNIHHPHLLLLLGACPDHSCLVYEYMENGSLEERLLQKDNTPPIPWFERYRIALEVASALTFLHKSKPKPIIHCDLKPANILLDHNFVSKIGDVGLSMLLPSDYSSVATIYRDTGLVGTLCYIDPEYQRTGLISPKSDVYAFGMVILQLLTAKPAIGLTGIVEEAVENGRLMGILDPEAGEWPIGETQELAVLGLRCAELQRRDRPDLKTEVLPVLEKLKKISDKARDLAPTVRSSPPQHFICPILQDVMVEPCVAADGYTYDRKAIEIWLKENENSPMTNLPLPNKNLLPNNALLSAIMEWKSRR
ncbi:U-box domain-containing protein 35-like [Macadamia integrifolia]|uniref:U-box domain-containing protein 35-like n=1 Tax=Macadamia integrifolia TaxID=60698 RepID=UPI001C4EA936|nr:U-box domain-containing protein 35-like [Macadamia integrifolia]XP_042487824.1 U-box domain-containing protein 35-like [Macadamia integrifolia]